MIRPADGYAPGRGGFNLSAKSARTLTVAPPPGSVQRERTLTIRRSKVQAVCWCERTVQPTTWDDIYAGRSPLCGHEDCVQPG